MLTDKHRQEQTKMAWEADFFDGLKDCEDGTVRFTSEFP